MLSFENLKVWQRSLKLARDLVIIANNLPHKYQYSFSDQLRRAALSIPSNIAEGAGRKSKKDSVNFYSIARGSLYESINILKLLEELKEVTAVDRIYSESEEIVKMLYGLSK